VGLFSIFGKKSPSQPAIDLPPPFPATGSQMGMMPDIDMRASDLPPLPPSDDLNKDIENQLAALKDDNAPSITNPVPLPTGIPGQDDFRWDTPVDNQNRLPEEINTSRAPDHQPDENWSTPNQPGLQTASASITGLTPTTTTTPTPPAAVSEVEEKGDDAAINIELPAFEGDEEMELKPLPTPAPKLQKIAPPPTQAPPPKALEEEPEEFKDIEQQLPSKFHSDVDVFVSVSEYAQLMQELQEVRKTLGSRLNTISSAINTHEREQLIFHQFHALLESNQRTLIKIDRTLFEVP